MGWHFTPDADRISPRRECANRAYGRFMRALNLGTIFGAKGKAPVKGPSYRRALGPQKCPCDFLIACLRECSMTPDDRLRVTCARRHAREHSLRVAPQISKSAKDVAICVEVAEHLPPSAANTIVNSITH